MAQPMMWDVAFFVGGLLVVAGGAELLVRGASRGASRLGLSQLLIGLTVVAFGTSAPETATSAYAALVGNGDLALGNVVGSNILNVLFVLGSAALIAPISVDRSLARTDLPILIGASLLTWWMAADGSIELYESATLLVGSGAYVAYAVRRGRKAKTGPKAEGTGKSDEDRRLGESESEGEGEGEGEVRKPAVGSVSQWALDISMTGGGIALLAVGAHVLVLGASGIAKALGLSDLVIGLTVVAAGTSIPEFATSIVAIFRGQRDIAVGNVIGSNLLNIFFVLGLSGVLAPNGIAVAEEALQFDLPSMVFSALLCLPILVTGYRITRWEGLALVAFYVLYVVHVVLLATNRKDEAESLRHVFSYGILPATVAVSLIALVKNIRPSTESTPRSNHRS